MLTKAVSVFAIIASVATMVSAEISFDTPNKTTLQQEIAGLELSVPVAAPVEERAHSPKDVKEWTIMVFVNGKNNLEPFALKDMNEMEMVGSSDKVNIVAETGRIAGYDSSDGDWKSTRRFLITKDKDPKKVTSPVVAEMGKVDMGDYKNVIDFVNWSKATYPAKKYMLIIRNHGSGWDKSVRSAMDRGISYDDETNHHITTPQMGLILKGVGGVDVYGSDACLMQMPEVVYEIKDFVPYVVGSEETEPGDGYTYNDLLAPLVAKPAMTAEELGKVAVDAYANHYEKQGEGYTQSLIKTAALSQFLTVTNDFAAALMAAGEKEMVKTAITGAQAYAVPDNHDMVHFAELVGAATKSADVKAKAAAFKAYITGTLVTHNRALANGYKNSNGIAAYMPKYSFNASYNELAWAKASQWDEFIKWYQAKK